MEKWKIKHKDLFIPFNLKDLDFKTTDDLGDMTHSVGQDRAYESMKFGFNIRRKGFNLYAMGPSGSGKFASVREFLTKKAAEEEVPSEWCYVNNFGESHRPVCLEFPAGRAKEFSEDIEHLLRDLRGAIPSAFDSEEFRNRLQEIEEEFKNKQHKVFSDLKEKAREEGISLMETPAGIVFAPIKDGDVLSPEKISELPEDEQKEVQEKINKFQKELGDTVISPTSRYPCWPAWYLNKITRGWMVTALRPPNFMLCCRHWRTFPSASGSL